MANIKQRIRALRLARIIVEEIQLGGNDYQNFKRITKYSSKEKYDLYKEMHKIHGLLERNLKIVEVAGGYDIYVPMSYSETYIEKCIQSGFSRWKAEIQVKGSMKKDENNRRNTSQTK